MECCFDAFHLTLLADDYLFLKPDQDNLAEIALMSLTETFDHLELSCDLPLEMLRDRPNTPQDHKMEQLQDSLQPRPPTAPGGKKPNLTTAVTIAAISAHSCIREYPSE